MSEVVGEIVSESVSETVKTKPKRTGRPKKYATKAEANAVQQQQIKDAAIREKQRRHEFTKTVSNKQRWIVLMLSKNVISDEELIDEMFERLNALTSPQTPVIGDRP
jgi:hypothetical protein